MKIKKFLNNIMQEELSPIRARRAEYEKDIPAVYEILKNGSETAREAAAQTMAEVKRAMRINYFEDAELIKSRVRNTLRSNIFYFKDNTLVMSKYYVALCVS